MNLLFQTVLEISLFAVFAISLLGICAPIFGARYGVKWRYFLWVILALRLVVPINISLPEPKVAIPVMEDLTIVISR